MSEKDDPKYKPIPMAITVAAQQVYQQQAQIEAQKQGSQPSQLQLDSGWGGRGR
jgi:hypothetical protein